MFSFYNTYLKKYADPLGQLKSIDELGRVTAGSGKELGSGTFYPVSVLLKGKRHRLHFKIPATLSQEGCLYLESEYGERCLANFTVDGSAAEDLKQLCANVVKTLPADLKEVEVTLPLTEDNVRTVLQTKVTSKTTGVGGDMTSLEDKAEKINALWDDKEEVQVECAITGLYYNKNKEELKLCISTVDIYRGILNRRSKRKAEATRVAVKRARK